MMKSAIGIIGALALIGTPAVAADLRVKAPPRPVAPVPNWSGLYVGINLGGGWAVGNVSDALFSGPNGTPPAGPVDSISANSSGVIGGGQIGYNWQTGNLVLGVEADVEGAGESTSGCVNTTNKGPTPPLDCVSSQIRSFGTVRGRVGYAADRWMLYGTGGFGWQNIAIREVFSAPPPSGLTGPTPGASPTTTRAGYVVGGGVETALWDRWIGGVEYLYMNTGGQTEIPVNFAAVGPSVVQTYHIQNNIVRARLSYRF